MVPGMPNTYDVTPLKKMKITPLNEIYILGIPFQFPDILDSFSVLYNPQSYSLSAQNKPEIGQTEKGRQFPNVMYGEMLKVDFFLDTFSAGEEIMGIEFGKSILEPLKFKANSMLPSYTKQLDVNDYVKKIYSLCTPDPEYHVPRIVKLEWGSLNFECYLRSCNVEYVKFKETGLPVRAIVHCVFVGTGNMAGSKPALPFESPDTSKFHRVTQGETLQSISQIAYDDPSYWRVIAKANGITNPRLMKNGQVLRMPALKE